MAGTASWINGLWATPCLARRQHRLIRHTFLVAVSVATQTLERPVWSEQFRVLCARLVPQADVIRKTAKARLSGSMPFPEIDGSLIKQGVEYYHVDWIASRTVKKHNHWVQARCH